MYFFFYNKGVIKLYSVYFSVTFKKNRSEKSKQITFIHKHGRSQSLVRHLPLSLSLYLPLSLSRSLSLSLPPSLFLHPSLPPSVSPSLHLSPPLSEARMCSV